MLLVLFSLLLACTIPARAGADAYGILILEDGRNYAAGSTLSAQDRANLQRLELCLDQIFADIKKLVLWGKNPHSKSEPSRKSIKDKLMLNIDISRDLIAKYANLNLQLKKDGKENIPLNKFGESLLFPRNEMFRTDGSLVYDGSRLTARKEVDLFVEGSTNRLRGIDGKTEKTFPNKQ